MRPLDGRGGIAVAGAVHLLNTCRAIPWLREIADLPFTGHSWLSIVEWRLPSLNDAVERRSQMRARPASEREAVEVALAGCALKPHLIALGVVGR